MDILEVEKSSCIGCGACISIDEEHFDWDDDGLSKVISNNNLKSENLTEAIESCPTQAITIAKTDEVYDGNITSSEPDFQTLEKNVMASSSQKS